VASVALRSSLLSFIPGRLIAQVLQDRASSRGAGALRGKLQQPFTYRPRTSRAGPPATDLGRLIAGIRQAQRYELVRKTPVGMPLLQ
jgi:hypothetical protein